MRKHRAALGSPDASAFGSSEKCGLTKHWFTVTVVYKCANCKQFLANVDSFLGECEPHLLECTD
jgi:hypothetical protein